LPGHHSGSWGSKRIGAAAATAATAPDAFATAAALAAGRPEDEPPAASELRRLLDRGLALPSLRLALPPSPLFLPLSSWPLLRLPETCAASASRRRWASVHSSSR
jgi:hypothetical protein